MSELLYLKVVQSTGGSNGQKVLLLCEPSFSLYETCFHFKDKASLSCLYGTISTTDTLVSGEMHVLGFLYPTGNE